MKKKRLLTMFLALILFISFASIILFPDFINRITGSIISAFPPETPDIQPIKEKIDLTDIKIQRNCSYCQYELKLNNGSCYTEDINGSEIEDTSIKKISITGGVIESLEACVDGLDNDEDGFIDCKDSDCSEDLICKKYKCKLKKAYWSKTSVKEGGEVSLIVEADNCDLEEVDFRIIEHDLIKEGDYPFLNAPHAIFHNGIAKSTWVAEYQIDSYNFMQLDMNPEYYFIASVVGKENKINSNTDKENLLKVNINQKSFSEKVKIHANAIVSITGRVIKQEIEQKGGFWARTNTHTHTTASDGSHSLDYVVDLYKNKNYNILVITDHNIFVDCSNYSNEKEVFMCVGGEEWSKTSHMNLIGVSSTISSDSQQEAIDKTFSEGGFVTLNHPDDYCDPIEKIKSLKGWNLIEIWNIVGEEFPMAKVLEQKRLNFWDTFLNERRQVFGLAVDDMHWEEHAFRGWSKVFMEEDPLTYDEFKDKMTSGFFYFSTGVSMDEQPFEIECDGKTLHMGQSGNCKEKIKIKIKAESEDPKYLMESIDLYSNQGLIKQKKCNKELECEWSQELDLPEGVKYYRIEAVAKKAGKVIIKEDIETIMLKTQSLEKEKLVRDILEGISGEEKKAYSNPIWVRKGNTPIQFKEETSYAEKEQTSQEIEKQELSKVDESIEMLKTEKPYGGNRATAIWKIILFVLGMLSLIIAYLIVKIWIKTTIN